MPEVYELANRECREVHRKVSAHKLSHPFQNPVDPVALGLPDYFEKIKHPMDLETIRGKLQRSAYSDGASFVSDMRLIFTNATTYNPPGSDVHIMANVLLEEFERLLKPYVRHVPAAKLAATIASAAPPQPEVEVIPELTSRQMSQLLNSVKRTDEAGWYFSEPVDPEKLGIPDYFAKILHPMDLGALRHRARARFVPAAGAYGRHARVLARARGQERVERGCAARLPWACAHASAPPCACARPHPAMLSMPACPARLRAAQARSRSGWRKGCMRTPPRSWPTCGSCGPTQRATTRPRQPCTTARSSWRTCSSGSCARLATGSARRAAPR